MRRKLGASPAPAGTNATTSFACTPAIFDGLAALSGSGATRALGTTLRTEKDTERFTGPADGQKKPGKPTAGTIPVTPGQAERMQKQHAHWRLKRA
jgi:hypothetical protein